MDSLQIVSRFNEFMENAGWPPQVVVRLMLYQVGLHAAKLLEEKDE